MAIPRTTNKETLRKRRGCREIRRATFASRTNKSRRGNGENQEIELILLNATREPLQRGVRNDSPAFVPGGNKRCFHLRDIVELLSRMPSPPLYTSTLSSQPFSPFPLASSILPQTPPNPTPHTGHAKMIYDRLSDLSLFLFRLPFSRWLSREHLHHLEASGMYHSPEEDSDLNGLQRARRCALQPRRNARIYYALQS